MRQGVEETQEVDEVVEAEEVAGAAGAAEETHRVGDGVPAEEGRRSRCNGGTV